MRRTWLAALALLLLNISVCRGAEDALEKGFADPPDSAKPHTWWHWMNGNISKEGITADLEAMKRVGIGGAQIFVADCDIPAGSVSFMSSQFREMIKHAASEADRLGLELCIHNCAGWSSSGGPWNTAEHAMQFVTTSSTSVKGPAKFSDTLAQPDTQLGYYRDIAVLAFKNSPDAQKSLASLHPRITVGASGDGSKLIDDNISSEVVLARPERDRPQIIRIDLDQPINARTIIITPGKGISDFSGNIEISDDGEQWRTLRPFAMPRALVQPLFISLKEPVSTSHVRLVIDRAPPRTLQIPLAEIDLKLAPRIENLQTKAGYLKGDVDAQTSDASPELAIQRDKVLDLTDKLSSDGKLTWDVPEGDWTILRIGHTPTGKDNHPAPKEGTGPECDKFSKEALDAHWNGYVQKLLDDIGPLAGKSLNNALIDSYEVGGQNWTGVMKQEFQKRRGYDMTPFLPVMSGHVVQNPQISERFLWDLRRTIADLFAENYYGHFAELCHTHGLKASIEPYTGPFESLQCGEPADIVMGEFWTGSQGHRSIKLASSVAHIFGKSIVGAESFTARPPEFGRWQEDPYAIKALGDLMFTQGINRYIFHRYAHQPWLDKFPGMTMGQWGFHMERTNTWFFESTSWLKYVARCQYLLQQGRFVADVAYFCGEDAPVEVKSSDPPLPVGYDYDSVNRDVLMKATVKDGRIVLDSGISYAVLVLPPKETLITPAMLQRIRDLVDQGATVVGPKPTRSPSLSDYPKCDEAVRALADEAWGNTDGKNVTEHALGKGKVIWGKTLAEAFGSLKADFEYPADSRAKLVYIHRATDDADIYFVSNQRNAYAQANCIFRVSGRSPQLWHPDSGKMEPAPIYGDSDGRTTVPIQFEPSGSVFVIFRKGDPVNAHLVQMTALDAPALKPSPKVQITTAVYEATDGAGSIDVRGEIQQMINSGFENVAVNNAAFGGDPAPNRPKQLRLEYSLDGKAVKKIAKETEKVDLFTGADAYLPPAYELDAPNGKVELLAWQKGSYEFKTSAGDVKKIKIDNEPANTDVAGAWQVLFASPVSEKQTVTFDHLISWTDHADDAIKYFSGTATYVKEIDISSDQLAGDRAVFLTLGKVKNLAEVKLNDQSLGILWKPPFRADISKIARPGKNKLEIRVTNLWPNRLIGDERMGEDAEWLGKKLARWPQWLLDGKPSPSGRKTFTTWHHWTKDMQPLESGLLGPVTIQSVERVKIQ